jgi:hypothetical protein
VTATEHLAFWTALDAAPESYVYVIQAEGDSPIKVGWAVDVPKRIAELQTGNPRRLRLIHLLVGERRLEHNLHRRIGRPSRLMGEWFDGEEVAPVMDLVQDLAIRMVATTRPLRRCRPMCNSEGWSAPSSVAAGRRTHELQADVDPLRVTRSHTFPMQREARRLVPPDMADRRPSLTRAGARRRVTWLSIGWQRPNPKPPECRGSARVQLQGIPPHSTGRVDQRGIAPRSAQRPDGAA